VIVIVVYLLAISVLLWCSSIALCPFRCPSDALSSTSTHGLRRLLKPERCSFEPFLQAWLREQILGESGRDADGGVGVGSNNSGGQSALRQFIQRLNAWASSQLAGGTAALAVQFCEIEVVDVGVCLVAGITPKRFVEGGDQPLYFLGVAGKW
jgi:hypothetical protein